MAMSMRMTRLVNIWISFVVQQVIMFSETRVGLYDVHTVSNSPFNRVPKTGTKSVTIIGRSEIDGTLLVWLLAQTQA